MTKTPEQYFADWENVAFGFGYGSGEPHILPVLKTFFGAIGDERGPECYNYEWLEAAVGQVPAWLLINTMCRLDIFEYGTSPRFGWLTEKGKRLAAFIKSKTADELVDIATRHDDTGPCYPDACNCGPNGYEPWRKCPNPFF